MRHAFTALAAVLALTPAHAGTERVAYPEGFETAFVRYQVVDRTDRKKARFMYMNQVAWEAARPGTALPDGAILVMEDHAVRMEDAEKPVTDSQGRLIATDEVTGVFVMEKRAGWGADYPDDMRNGDWEYAWFNPDGTRTDKTMERCFECHKAQAAEDFTFTAFQAVTEQK